MSKDLPNNNGAPKNSQDTDNEGLFDKGYQAITEEEYLESLTPEERRMDKLAEMKYKAKHCLIGFFISALGIMGAIITASIGNNAAANNDYGTSVYSFIFSVLFFMLTIQAYRQSINVLKL